MNESTFSSLTTGTSATMLYPKVSFIHKLEVSAFLACSYVSYNYLGQELNNSLNKIYSTHFCLKYLLLVLQNMPFVRYMPLRLFRNGLLLRIRTELTSSEMFLES